MGETICFIAARGGSKGVPRKNIRPLAGKPLIAHTIEKAKMIFETVIVSTEDAEIAKVSKEYGATVPFVRPAELATDTAAMTGVLLHGVEELQQQGYDLDTVVVRDCTAPFIRNSDTIAAISLLTKNKCDMVCGVYLQHNNPYFNMMEPDPEGFLKFIKSKHPLTSRQQSPAVYQLCGLWVISVSSFLKYKQFYMPKALPQVVPIETGTVIDTEFDFQMAECIAHNNMTPND